MNESVDVSSESEATAIYCAYDGLIVLGPTGPDGQPTTVNDEVMSYRYEYRTYLEDGHWMVGGQDPQGTLGQGNLCPPAA